MLKNDPDDKVTLKADEVRDECEPEFVEDPLPVQLGYDEYPGLFKPFEG